MKKRRDYICDEATKSSDDGTVKVGGAVKIDLDDDVDNRIENDAIIMSVSDSPAMASGTSMQTSAHSTGLMFENSVTQQNSAFLLGTTSTVQGSKGLLDTFSLKGSRLSLENDLANSLNNPSQFHALSKAWYTGK